VTKKKIFTGILVIPWKTNTPENKIYTGPIAKHLFFFSFFLLGGGANFGQVFLSNTGR
jgi:hypothetical protein